MLQSHESWAGLMVQHVQHLTTRIPPLPRPQLSPRADSVRSAGRSPGSAGLQRLEELREEAAASADRLSLVRWVLEGRGFASHPVNQHAVACVCAADVSKTRLWRCLSSHWLLTFIAGLTGSLLQLRGRLWVAREAAL